MFWSILLLLLGSTAPTLAKPTVGQSWKSVDELPKQFQGRWAVIESSGKVALKACLKDGAKSADLFVGPSWLVHEKGQGFLTKIEFSAPKMARYEIVDNGGDEIGVGVELMTLSNGIAEMEIASDPEIGFEVTHYKRCPDA